MAQLSKQALIVENNTSFPNNNTNYITPSILRSFNVDMIDSLVDENGYIIDSGSWNRSISSLNQFTASAAGLSTGSLLVTASANINVITFTKGDGTTFNVTVADTTNLTPLNQFTASQATINTAIGASTSSLNTFTSSANTQLTNLATSQSIDATKFATIGTQSGSWGAGSSPGIISGSAQISALGFVSSSVTASSLTTASVNLNTITFTKGDASTFNITINTGSGGGGGSTDITSLNAFTASQETKNTTLASVTASLNSATASLLTSASLSLYTASVSGQLLSFTKGNNSVFTLTLPTGSGTYVTGSYGAFQDSTTQSGSANTAYKMKFNTTDVSDGVILSGSTGLKVGAYGVYNLEWSGQLNEGAGAETTSVWLRINGIDVVGSRGDVTVASNTNLLPAWNYFLTLNQNDVVELMWSSTGGNTTWAASPASITPTRPSVASIIATLSRVDVGGGSNSVSNTIFNAYTSSINAYTASNDTKWTTLQNVTSSLIAATGSFATTGSNNFTGIQTLGDAALNAVSLVEVSSSLMLVAKGFTSASAHLSSSINSGSNLIFKYNSQTVDTIISGSGNIFPNFAPAAAGFKRYVGGSGNIFTSETGVALSGSIAFPVNMSKNMGDNIFTLRGPVSSSAWALDQNLMLGGTTSIGTSAANNAEKIVGGLTFSQNANWGGTFGIIAIKNSLSASVQVTSNLIFGAAVTANLNSSSMNYSSNIQNGGITINNNYTPVATSTNNNARIGVLINTIYGVNHRLNTGGTNTSATNSIRSMYAGFLAGSNISASIEGTGDNTSLVAVGLLGNGLIVSGSSTNPNVTPLTNADGTHGSFIAGRYNAVDGTKALSAETVFAVGTGTGHNNRKTGFLIDSGSNTFIEGTLNVSGSTTITGSLTLSSSAAIELNVIGNMTITGSASGNVVSMSITSNTASLDFNAGNYFELTASVSPLNINVINLSRGTTSTLSISGSTASTITFSPNVQQPSGSLYTASVSGQTDILSFVAFNTSKVNVVSTLKMI
jgi:hypothetical protein